MIVAHADVLAADGHIQQARAAYQQALDELQTKQELIRRNQDVVARREIEKLEVTVEQRQGAVASASAAKQAAETRLSALLPAQKASAEAALAQAEVELEKTVVRAGVNGRVEQFALRTGDIVNPMMRAAGILIPEEGGSAKLVAGFGQIEAQVMKVGMLAEVTCVSKPWTIIPMVVTGVQDFIAAGQFRGGEQLVDAHQVARPGTILVFLEPLYQGGLDGVTPGSSCIANAYTSNHERLASKDIGGTQALRASCGGCGRRRARHAAAVPGAAAADPDASVQRPLTQVRMRWNGAARCYLSAFASALPFHFRFGLRRRRVEIGLLGLAYIGVEFAGLDERIDLVLADQRAFLLHAEQLGERRQEDVGNDSPRRRERLLVVIDAVG